MTQLDFFRPPIAKFAVRCEPSGYTMFVRAASYNGAKRAAKDNQLKRGGDRFFYPRFWMWERPYGAPKIEGEPPQEFEWPKF